MGWHGLAPQGLPVASSVVSHGHAFGPPAGGCHPSSAGRRIQLTLCLPDTLRAEPETFAQEIGAGVEGSFPFVLTATEMAEPGRLPIAVDVVFAERRWGELTEAIVEVAE
ncbi:MAG: hypothetical protein KAX80_12855 [Planctomycetes bacterium]|nr:hypothetical protein [Planctomycetota bacterium]